MKNLMPFLVFVCLSSMFSCSIKKEIKAISAFADYGNYVTAFGAESNKKISACDSEIKFWQNKLSLAVHPAFYWKRIAQQHQSRFDLSGDIHDITVADSLLRLVVEKTFNPSEKSGLYNQLSALAITRHDFVEARDFAGKAVEGNRAPTLHASVRS